jgi:hypothetical protein
MNILILDRNPSLAARYHCDRDVARHLLDAVQALHAAHYYHDGPQAAAARCAWSPVNVDARHPCARWTQTNSANYNWTLGLFGALLQEYKNRRGHAHAYLLLYPPLSVLPMNISRDTELTPFHRGVPIDYRIGADVVMAYRLWYFREKRDKVTWSYPAETPEWWKELEVMSRPHVGVRV